MKVLFSIKKAESKLCFYIKYDIPLDMLNNLNDLIHQLVTTPAGAINIVGIRLTIVAHVCSTVAGFTT